MDSVGDDTARLLRLICIELAFSNSRRLVSLEFNPQTKHIKSSEEARKRGNKMFTRSSHNADVHEKIWGFYSASVALAPSGSATLAFAYANRSALLLHLRKYEDSVRDIDAALKITEQIPLRVKLLCRKAECLIALGKPEKHVPLEEAKSLLEKINDNDDEKARLLKTFNKTKIVFEKDQVEVSSEQFEAEHRRVHSCIESKGIFHSIAINDNEKYGKHLIATTDVKPGEVIFVSKPYTTVLKMNEFHTYCNNCSAINWSGIPCNNCIYAMFCSEECKQEALKKYHDIECSCVPYLVKEGVLDYKIHSALRAVVMAVKEFGSIDELTNQMRDINNPENNKIFFSDNKFKNNSFKSLFINNNVKFYLGDIHFLVKGSCKAGVTLAQYTSFFGQNCKLNTTKDILANKDVVFICMLILKVAMISFTIGRKISEPNEACAKEKDEITCASKIPSCERGFSVDPIHQFIPHSCNPNVSSVIIDGGKELWFTLQPIKKGDMLFDCYEATFFESNKFSRYRSIIKRSKDICRCIACIENWPTVLAPNGRVMAFEDIIQIVVDVAKKSDSGKNLILIGHGIKYDQTIVNDLIKIMNTAFTHTKQPSQELCAMIYVLRFVFDRMHGTKLRIPDKCRKVH